MWKVEIDWSIKKFLAKNCRRFPMIFVYFSCKTVHCKIFPHITFFCFQMRSNLRFSASSFVLIILANLVTGNFSHYKVRSTAAQNNITFLMYMQNIFFLNRLWTVGANFFISKKTRLSDGNRKMYLSIIKKLYS